MYCRSFCVLVLTLASLMNVATAADKADPTGTWNWSVTVQEQKRDMTLKLKLDGDTLTGTMLGRNNQETNIDDASFKDGEVAFSVTRERNGTKSTTKYKGKLDGDTIKGKSESDRNGQAQNRDWEATRAKS